MRDVAVAALHVVDRAADGVAGRQRHVDLTVDEGLDELEDILVHLVAVAVDELDAVVGVGVVGGADHDAAVKAAVNRLVGDAGGGDDVQQVGVGTGGHEAGNEGALEHVARAARVLAHHDAGLALLARAVVPAHVAADQIRVVDGQPLVRRAAEAIGAKVLHWSPSKWSVREDPLIVAHVERASTLRRETPQSAWPRTQRDPPRLRRVPGKAYGEKY